MNQTDISISADTAGWYEFISKIPKSQYINFDYSLVPKIYAQLKGCKICGAVAVVENICRNCAGEIWPNEQKQAWGYKNELEYLKEEQLDYFSTWEKEDKIDFNILHFEKDLNWALLVTENDLQKYSKENNW